jgi:hypothetical protein
MSITISAIREELIDVASFIFFMTYLLLHLAGEVALPPDVLLYPIIWFFAYLT